LVKELTQAGHEIWYFSFEQFRDQIEAAGAHFLPCDGYDFEMEDKENGARVGKDKAFASELLVSATLALDEMAAENIARIQPDLIVSDSVAFWGKLTAMKYGLPYVCSTTTFAFNRYSAAYMKEGPFDIAKMLLTMPKINRQIKRLRDKGYPVKGFLDIVQNDNETNTIVYTSKEFQPRSETFSDRYHFIGPSIRPVQTPVEKTADKTVYISMGTVDKDEAFYHRCIEALRDTDYQVILSMGMNAEQFTDLPDHIKAYPSVDQMAVLSITDCFVTQCGMNSASEGLYFEVPLVLFPQTPEQDAVAKRAEELGAGLRLADTSAAGIRKAVETVLHEPSYKKAAMDISAGFKKCGGYKEAREFIESLI
ncbi:MAG: glucosyltransferase, partial [Firmicutes bacterium]|nr:glucosyltransferase [Bacillota bacterium]